MTLKIEGMMCKHCQARVEKALKAVAGVEAVEVIWRPRPQRSPAAPAPKR